MYGSSRTDKRQGGKTEFCVQGIELIQSKLQSGVCTIMICRQK